MDQTNWQPESNYNHQFTDQQLQQQQQQQQPQQQQLQQQPYESNQFISSPPLQPSMAPYQIPNNSTFSAPYASTETIFSKTSSYPSTQSSFCSVSQMGSQFSQFGSDSRNASGLPISIYPTAQQMQKQSSISVQNHQLSSNSSLPSLPPVYLYSENRTTPSPMPTQLPPIQSMLVYEPHQLSNLQPQLPQLNTQLSPVPIPSYSNQSQSPYPSLSSPTSTSSTKFAFGSPTWTPEADAKLILLKEEQGLGWSEIAEYFPSRTSNACQFRWRRLKNRELNRKKKEERKRKVQERLKFE